MVKLFRKIFLVTSIKHVELVINHCAPIFHELYRLLWTTNIIPYNLPTRKSLYDDKKLNKNKLLYTIHQVIFRRTVNFGYIKTKKRGRIKRKIRRRLLQKNNVMD